MNHRWTIGIALIVVIAALTGCEQKQAPDDGVDDEAGEEYHSPFMLEGDSQLTFDTVTFTDVGLRAREPGPADDYLLEAIAESLAYEFRRSSTLEFEATVAYEDELRDPSNHLLCDRDRLYVALWRGYSPDRWGYSLWSGCHHRQKFAWEELPDDVDEEADVVSRVEPLTRSIVESVAEAHAEDCFSVEC